MQVLKYRKSSQIKTLKNNVMCYIKAEFIKTKNLPFTDLSEYFFQ